MPLFPPKETHDRRCADKRNFYKVEEWDVTHQIVAVLYAGSSLDRAREVFDAAKQHRPLGRYTLRQRARMLDKWPEA